MELSRIPVLIVGATGQLGALITKHCLANQKLIVNVLVRNPDKNPELVKNVESSGGKVIKADVTNPETLKGCTKGIHTIISALIGDDKTVVDGQNALLKDALETKDVKRFVPSDFSEDFNKLQEDEHPFLGQRIRFKKALAQTPIKGLHVFQGMFIETFFWAYASGFRYWESPDIKFDLTTYEDTAKFVAAAVANPDRVGDLFVRGNELTTREVVDIYNKVRGTNLEAKRLGSLDDLKNTVANLKAKGEFLKSAILGYAIPMIDGRGKLTKIQNDEIPEVKVTSIEEFLIQNPSRVVVDKA